MNDTTTTQPAESAFPLSPLQDYRAVAVVRDAADGLARLRSRDPANDPEWNRLYDLMVDAEDSLRVRMASHRAPSSPAVVRYDRAANAYVPIEVGS